MCMPYLQTELSDLAPERLKDWGRVFREAFLSRLGLLLRGTVAAPPEKFGETLADEHIRGGKPCSHSSEFSRSQINAHTQEHGCTYRVHRACSGRAFQTHCLPVS